MVLPSENWDIDGNGFRGTLTIDGVDAAGNLNASVVFEFPEVQQIIGFWDGPSPKLMFVRAINPDGPSANQTWTGSRPPYVFSVVLSRSDRGESDILGLIHPSQAETGLETQRRRTPRQSRAPDGRQTDDDHHPLSQLNTSRRGSWRSRSPGPVANDFGICGTGSA